MWSVLTEIRTIVDNSSIYLLFGFALAGLMHVLLRRTPRFMNLFSGRGSRSVVLAALFGAPLPLCSCSVLPVGLTLHRKGASKGATASFLISSPETDVASILLTYGLLGPTMAIFRPFASVVTAITTGYLVNLVDHFSPHQDGRAFADGNEAQPDHDHGYEKTKGPVWNALRYGFVDFFDDIMPSLLLGIVLGGVITTILPDLGLEGFAQRSFVSMVAMLVIGIPMYVCATSSTPIAAGLIAGGLSPGAALVFLLVGPATNIASIVVLAKQLGRRFLSVYLCSIAATSLLMGLWLDAMVGSKTFSLPDVSPASGEASVTPIKTASSIVLMILTYLSFRRSNVLWNLLERGSQAAGVPLRSRGVKVVAACCALAAYLGSGLFIVGPGERAVITRFGRITQANVSPGLHYRYPYPLGGTDIERVHEVKRIELGFRGKRAAVPDEPFSRGGGSFVEESWMLTGNEDIIDIKFVVQYQVRDTETGTALLDYLYGIGDKEALVRSAAESAIRSAIGSRNIETLLTTERGRVEGVVRNDLLQPMLDGCRAGIRVVDVSLLDVHAPSDVHWAFRDVATAVEDKETAKNKAWENDERVVRQANGEAARQILDAQAKATDAVARAHGEASAFTDQLRAYGEHPATTRLRLYFESIDAVLGHPKKYIRIGNGSCGRLDLWLLNDAEQVQMPQLPPPGTERQRSPVPVEQR